MDLPPGAWPGLQLGAPLAGGHRNEVWSATIDGAAVAVRRLRRSAASLQWEVDLLTTVAGRGFHVAEPVPTIDGALTCERIVVQRWVGGHKPSSPQDWALVADELRRLHDLARDVGQRPGCCVVAELADRRTSVDADLDRVPADVAALVTGVFADFEDVRTAVVHGDPAGSNVRVDDGLVWLLDSDESRVDLVWHDLSNLGVAVLDPIAHARAQRLSDAWEAINAWQVEPEYARMRLQRLRGAPSG